MPFTLAGSTGLTFTNSTTQTTASKWSQVVVQQLAGGVRYSSTNPNNNYLWWVPLGPKLTIVPTSVDSKILLLYSASVQMAANAHWTFLRNGQAVTTDINNLYANNGVYGMASENRTNGIWYNMAPMFIDTPKTTAAVQYQLGVGQGNSVSCYLNDYSGFGSMSSHFVAIEILP